MVEQVFVSASAALGGGGEEEEETWGLSLAEQLALWLRKRRSSSRGHSSWHPPQLIRSLHGLPNDIVIGFDIWWKSSRFNCTACMSWANILTGRTSSTDSSYFLCGGP